MNLIKYGAGILCIILFHTTFASANWASDAFNSVTKAVNNAGGVKNLISNGIESAADSIVFDDTAVRTRAHQLKGDIRQQMNINQRQIQMVLSAEQVDPIVAQQVSEIAQHEKIRASNEACSPSDFASKLITEVFNTCNYLEVVQNCIQTTDIVDQKFQKYSDKITTTTGMRMSDFEAAHKELVLRTQEAINANNTCADSFREQLLKNDCLNVYDKVFNADYDHLRNTCTPDAIDTAVDLFVEKMRSQDGPAMAIMTVTETYKQSRKVEIKMAEILVGLDTTLAQLRTSGEPATAVLKSARPLQKPSRAPSEKQ